MSVDMAKPDTMPAGTRLKGPTALGSDPRRLLRLTIALAVTDFKLRFFGSVLGYLWQLMRPLLLFGVLYLVFSLVFNLGSGVDYWPVALLLGIVVFSFFTEATGGAVRSLVLREGLVRKVEFPRLAVPMATVLTASFNLVLNLLPVVVFLLIAGGRPRWSWLEIPFLLLLVAVFALGCAMLLSALFVRYRDIEPIWDVVLQALFYCTPILYTLQLVEEKSSETVVQLMMFNPIGAIIEQGRHALLGPSYLGVVAALREGILVLVPLGIVAAACTIGFWYFNREAPRVADDL